MSTAPFHLGYFMNGSHAQGWATPWHGTTGKDWRTGSFHVDVARTLERGRFDFLLFEDAYHVPNYWNGSTEAFAHHGVALPRLDTLVLATHVAARTERIGLVATLPTYAYAPYLLARLVGSLDSLSGGRAAWNVVTGSSTIAARNFGRDGLGRPDDRYAHAMEYVELCKRLWDSWDADAILDDHVNGVFADHKKIHDVEFSGEWIQHSGSALVSGPSPQGRPVIAQAGASPAGKLLAATHADVVVAGGRTAQDMKAYRDTVLGHVVEQGRDPDATKVLFSISPVIAPTEEEAQDRLRYMRAEADRHAMIEILDHANRIDIDLSGLPMDEPLTARHLEGLHTDGQRSGLARFVEMAEGRTLRQVGVDSFLARATQWCGSFEQIADKMEETVAEIGGDGFLFSDKAGRHTRRNVVEVVDGLVPVLQRRGLVREEYTETTLRGNLLAF
ncbi:NtaA/DmoA family FMN-dependent monooxygenase [Cellulomonas sp. NPDC057328]|uniref:NtaA/DmoA family FMN-dependent monooxygenase n=1 Tax=Cellulomonas sp. NPDC057328 TaxID=3346101 RepID=UPI00363AF47B